MVFVGVFESQNGASRTWKLQCRPNASLRPHREASGSKTSLQNSKLKEGLLMEAVGKENQLRIIMLLCCPHCKSSYSLVVRGWSR